MAGAKWKIGGGEVGGGEREERSLDLALGLGCINQTCYNAIVRKCSEFSMYVGTRDSLVLPILNIAETIVSFQPS